MNRITAAMYARYSECGTRNAVLETSYEIRTSRFQVKRNVVYKNILTQSVYRFLIDQFFLASTMNIINTKSVHEGLVKSFERGREKCGYRFPSRKEKTNSGAIIFDKSMMI